MAVLEKHFIPFFAGSLSGIEENLVLLKNEIEANGMIWVSWPKKTSGVVTNITEDIVRDIALQCGLVDVKVCAIDNTWSGLKLVIPLKDRPPAK